MSEEEGQLCLSGIPASNRGSGEGSGRRPQAGTTGITVPGKSPDGCRSPEADV